MPRYREVLQVLAARRRLGMKLGLENMEALAAALGSPHRKLRFVHLAGTNGKGSTAAFLASLLRAGGQRVGLFTSPHLLSVRERIAVDGAPIPRPAFIEGITRVTAAATAQGLEPTFFETLTALALWHFEREQVDWVVWETGLGGRLDSTNIVTPAVSIITNIGSDHASFLGDSPAKIAIEKAGIIKPSVPVVTAETEAEPLSILRRIAREKNAPLHEITPAEVAALPPLRLSGPHQRRNAACAVAAHRLLAALGLPDLPEEKAAQALAQTTWPGRFEIVRGEPEPPFVVDGAHNPEGIAAALAAWRDAFGALPFRLVYGGMSDKDHAVAARLLLPQTRETILLRATGERAAEPATLLAHFPGARLAPSLPALWPELLSHPMPTLLLGSLTLVGEALRLAGLSTLPPEEQEAEADLNELLSPLPIQTVPLDPPR
ncbi:dihydrofolate synthase / folylpolyglutamate synthase [Verrucomicrobium sp. GAS474]|uniref:bifunctional folylpolyglutamate synthase/dihydrofolate synthase n=1 Tax=Verrucomicrobium sp. GAS474 TaxID=1882831 RepID=UPI00087D91A1|nr:folylpolyglutamate synthase/dihydrofolate synthase family protein [Verrucomicrobium sp. GAS474]SDU30182.1 dihydrofolate synthase / folylpolyglutamate synthase [Verrucomicrobium sp. GAS474]